MNVNDDRIRIVGCLDEFKELIKSVLDPNDEHNARESFSSDRDFLFWALHQFFESKR